MNKKTFLNALSKALKIFMLTTAACISVRVAAQSTEDETVSIINNWTEGDYCCYRTYSGRLRIEGNDTIHEHEDQEIITKVLLSAQLPNDDKVFVITTQHADSAKTVKDLSEQPLYSLIVDGVTEDENTASTAKDKAEICAQLLKLMEMPVTILTDFSGEVKDIYDYDSLRAEMDSCFDQITAKIEEKEIPDETKQSLLLNMRQIWNEGVKKEALMERATLFRYYGYEYPLGTTVENTKLPIVGDEYLVDATVTFSCDIVESESGKEYIEISSLISYDAEQILDSLLSSMVDEQAHALRQPDRPVITINVLESFLFEPKKGTMVEHTQDRRTMSEGKTIIEYSACKLE